MNKTILTLFFVLILAFPVVHANGAIVAIISSQQRDTEEQVQEISQSGCVSPVDYCNEKGGKLFHEYRRPLNEYNCKYPNGDNEEITTSCDGTVVKSVYIPIINGTLSMVIGFLVFILIIAIIMAIFPLLIKNK